MLCFRRAAIGTFTATLLASGVVLGTGSPALAVVEVKLTKAIENLPVATETRSGYSRASFTHWIDANGDCQNARAEVLRQESKKAVTGACTVVTGKWKSWFDGVSWTKASDVDIDHLVPLAEAWDSGAKKWDAATRKAFANDLGDKRTLVTVTDNVNQSKADRDPAEWLPARKQCRYVEEWVAVKIRWSLKADAAEKNALRSVARDCTNVTITVAKAEVATGGSAGAGSGSPSSAGTDPRFSYCYQAQDAGYGPYYAGKDVEYGWYRDADTDGVVCE